jgi:hypothetical protein
MSESGTLPEATRSRRIRVRELQAYGRTLYTPVCDDAELLNKLCRPRDNFNRRDLVAIEALGFDVDVIPSEWRVR